MKALALIAGGYLLVGALHRLTLEAEARLTRGTSHHAELERLRLLPESKEERRRALVRFNFQWIVLWPRQTRDLIGLLQQGRKCRAAKKDLMDEISSAYGVSDRKVLSDVADRLIADYDGYLGKENTHEN